MHSKSQNNPPPPLCFWHTTQSQSSTVRTVPELLKNAGHDGKPPGFWAATLAWASQNLGGHLLANSLRYQGPKARNSVKKQLMTLALLCLAHRMPFWTETRRYLTRFAKRWLLKSWKQEISAAITNYKNLPTPPLCFSHTLANHPPTAHSGLTLIGDEKQTIIQAYTRPGKIPKPSCTVKSYSSRPHSLNAFKVSKQPSPSPLCFWHTTQSQPSTVRTVPELLKNAGHDGKPPGFWAATLAWASQNLGGHLLANSLRYIYTQKQSSFSSWRIAAEIYRAAKWLSVKILP